MSLFAAYSGTPKDSGLRRCTTNSSNNSTNVSSNYDVPSSPVPPRPQRLQPKRRAPVESPVALPGTSSTPTPLVRVNTDGAARQRSRSFPDLNDLSSSTTSTPESPIPTFSDLSLTPSELEKALNPSNQSGPKSGSFVRHLVLVIPGMGPHEQLSRNVAQLRKEYEDLVKAHFPLLPARMVIDFVAFDWQKELHRGAVSLCDQTVSMLSLSNLGPIRNFFKEACIDIMYFMSPTHWKSIVSTVIIGLNKLYKSYVDKYASTSSITVSIYGHSLGGIIAYDVIDNQRDTSETYIRGLPSLDFSPWACWCFGSAVGLFLAVRGKTPGSLPNVFSNGSCGYFFNIFHPSDPLAYRFEPLVKPSLAGTCPVVMPHWRTLCTRRTIPFFNDERVATKFKTKGPINPLQGRFDFELQPKNNLKEINDYVAMTNVHTSYWTSADCVLFILTQLIRQHFLEESYAGNTQLTDC